MEFRTPEQTAEELKQYFDQQERFEFERALGHGAYGITSKVLDKKTNPPRRLAVKRALGSDTERELQNEIRYLKVSDALDKHIPPRSAHPTSVSSRCGTYCAAISIP